jgi:hypothetical protein
MYQRSSRRPLTILVALSLALNAFLIVACVQLSSSLEATNRRVERMSTTIADSEELTKWANRMRGCLDELANGGNGDKPVPRSCLER